MKRQTVKRKIFRNHKYFYTALRFMVEIYRAKKNNVEVLDMIKTQHSYLINANYIAELKKKTNGWGSLKKIPIAIYFPIRSKDRNDLKIEVPNKYWKYRARIWEDLKPFYISMERNTPA